MKRCLKFKAKAIHNGEWVYGLPVHYNRNPRTEKWTMREDFGMETDIDIETLCQYVGHFPIKDDIEGVDIYEGDYLLFSIDDIIAGKGIVSYRQKIGAFKICHNAFGDHSLPLELHQINIIKVLKNIYDIK